MLGAWVLLAAGLVLFMPQPDPLANELRVLLPEDAPTLAAMHALQRHFGATSGLSQAAIVIERQQPYTKATMPSSPSSYHLTVPDLEALETLVTHLRQRGVPSSLGIGQPALAVRAPSDTPPILHDNPMISPDGQAAVAFVEIPSNFVTLETIRTAEWVDQQVRQIQWPAGLAVAVTGSAGYGRDYLQATVHSYHRSFLVTVVAVLAILLLVYRSPVASVAVLGAITVAAVIAGKVLDAGTPWGLHAGTAERIFVMVLLYGLGVDYSLLYLSRFSEMLRAGLPSREAAARALAGTGPTILASAGTNLIGLAMLAFARFRIFATAGVAIPVALTVPLLVSLTLVPAMAAILGRRLFWPQRKLGLGTEKIWSGMAQVITARPWAFLILPVLLLAWPAVHGARQRYTYDVLSGLDPSYDSVRGMQMTRRHWPVGELGPTRILLEADGPAGKKLPDDAKRLTEQLLALEGVADVRSLSQPLGKAYQTPGLRLLLSVSAEAQQRVKREYLAADGHATRLEAILKYPPLSDDAMATVARIRELSGQLDPGTKAYVAGPTAEMADTRAVTQADFKRILLLVSLVVFLMVLALLRDVILSAFMLATTVLTYLATLGLTQVVFVGLLGAPALDWKVQVFLFVVLVAVGQDYNIFLAGRLAEESVLLPPREAAKAALVRTGGIISAAGLIMAASLGSLASGDLALLRELGFAFALGMLLDTFIVRPLMLPAFAVLTGRTGRPLRRRKG